MRCKSDLPFLLCFSRDRPTAVVRYNPLRKVGKNPGSPGCAMRDFCSLIRTIGLFAMVLVVTALHAQDGLSDALSHLDFSCDFSGGLLGHSVATADFNNDTHPSVAVLLHNNHSFRIEVHSRFRQVGRITFASNLPALAIAAFDVNHDGSPDLVVEEPFSQQRLFIWLNDGYGFFHPAHVADYPAEGGSNNHRFTSPLRNSESIALAAPGKMRCRQSVHESSRPQRSFGVTPNPNRTAPVSMGFDYAPNPHRGPPSSLLL